MKKPVEQLEEWEWIEKYWSGQLSPAEHTFFEQTMQQDSRLAREAESLRFGIHLVEEARINAHARQTVRRLQQNDRRRRQRVVWWGLGAGTLAAACLIAVFYLAYAPIRLPSGESDPGVLRELRGQHRSDSTDHLSLRQKQAFDLFFEGQAYLAEGQPQRAAQRFEAVLRFPEIRLYFREAAQWHLVICYLKVGQIDKAQRLYDQLGATDAYGPDWLERQKIGWHLTRLAWLGTASPD